MHPPKNSYWSILCLQTQAHLRRCRVVKGLATKFSRAGVRSALRPAKQGWRRVEEFMLIFNSQMRWLVFALTAQLYCMISCFSISATSTWEYRNAFPANPQAARGFSLPFPHLLSLSCLQRSQAFQGAAHLFIRVCVMQCIMRLPGTVVTNTITLLQSSPPCKPAFYEQQSE